MLRIVLADWDAARTEASRIRLRVFVEEQRVPAEIELDEHDAETGKMYGKVTAVRPLDDNLKEADIRFTSVSQDVYRIIRQIEKSQ